MKSLKFLALVAFLAVSLTSCLGQPAEEAVVEEAVVEETTPTEETPAVEEAVVEEAVVEEAQS